MFIATYDRNTGMISFPYETDEGERIRSESFAIGPGLTSRVIRDRAPLRLRTAAEIAELGAILSGTNAESWLGVPILTGDEVLGVIALESLAEDAFDAATERLLATLATSVGAALENARLFDETKRLLAETDARAGELTVINEIGDALARQLDFGAIIDSSANGSGRSSARDRSRSASSTRPTTRSAGPTSWRKATASNLRRWRLAPA